MGEKKSEVCSGMMFSQSSKEARKDHEKQISMDLNIDKEGVFNQKKNNKNLVRV